MANPEWGKKRLCQSGGETFYDLKRNPIVCPKCGTEFVLPNQAKARRPAAPVAKEKPAAPPEKAKEAVEVETEEFEEDLESDDDDNLIEDASDLGEDEDDMSEVKEHIETDLDGKE